VRLPVITLVIMLWLARLVVVSWDDTSPTKRRPCRKNRQLQLQSQHLHQPNNQLFLCLAMLVARHRHTASGFAH
jgi:hypothetical protein